MGLSARQFRMFIVRPTLQRLNLWSASAEILVLGTAALESGGFRFIDQITGPADDRLGPAYGLYQIEPATHDDLWANFLAYHADLKGAAANLRAISPDPHTQLVTNLAYATAICRLIYYRARPPLPQADDLPGFAAYWKRHYNTPKGKGTEAQWLNAWEQHCRAT